MSKSLWRAAAAVAAVGWLWSGAERASAITIDLIFKSSGQSFSGGVGTAGNAPANAVGGGSLGVLMDLAATYWESAFADTHTLTLEYGWSPLTAAGTHNLISEGGTPHRETYGTVRFDNDQSFVWFLDSTPTTNSEFSTFTNYTQDLGGGVMNTGREWTGGSGSAANFDLLTTAIHEVGHALGLSGANNAYVAETGDLDIDLTGGTYTGAAIPVDSGSAHLNLLHPLLRSSRPNGVRRFASEADILANAQISGFTQINLQPAIPEPSLGAIALVGIGAMLIRRRRGA